MESIQEMDDKFAETAKKNIENAKVFKMKEQDAAHSSLSPCPFCESQPEWINEALSDDHFYIRCPHCHIVMKEDRRDKVIGMWNRRAELTRLRSELQQKDEVIENIKVEYRNKGIDVCRYAAALWSNENGKDSYELMKRLNELKSKS